MVSPPPLSLLVLGPATAVEPRGTTGRIITIRPPLAVLHPQNAPVYHHPKALRLSCSARYYSLQVHWRGLPAADVAEQLTATATEPAISETSILH